MLFCDDLGEEREMVRGASSRKGPDDVVHSSQCKIMFIDSTSLQLNTSIIRDTAKSDTSVLNYVKCHRSQMHGASKKRRVHPTSAGRLQHHDAM